MSGEASSATCAKEHLISSGSADQVKVEALAIVNLLPPQPPEHCHPSSHRSSAWPLPPAPPPPSPARPPNKARLGLPPAPPRPPSLGLTTLYFRQKLSPVWVFVNNCHNLRFSSSSTNVTNVCCCFGTSKFYLMSLTLQDTSEP